MRSPTVSSVMTENVITVQPQATFKDVVGVLTSHGISAVPVVDADGALVGVVSEADLVSKEEFEGGTGSIPVLAGPARRRRWHQSDGFTAAELMNHKVLTVATTDTVTFVAKKLASAGVRRLFVVDAAGRLVGVVSRRDLLKLYLRSDEELADEIRTEVLRSALWIEEAAVQVEVADGIATMTGTVPRSSEAALAIRLARALPGVVGVQNQLKYEFDDLAGAGAGAL